MRSVRFAFGLVLGATICLSETLVVDGSCSRHRQPKSHSRRYDSASVRRRVTGQFPISRQIKHYFRVARHPLITGEQAGYLRAVSPRSVGWRGAHYEPLTCLD
jgi:hypothetical protein